MKQRFLFILPRLAVLAVLIGAASLVLFLLFKLLLLIVVIGAIGAIAGKIISKARNKWMEHSYGPFGQGTGHHRLYGPATVQPVVNNQVSPAIIPIN